MLAYIVCMFLIYMPIYKYKICIHIKTSMPRWEFVKLNQNIGFLSVLVELTFYFKRNEDATSVFLRCCRDTVS